MQSGKQLGTADGLELGNLATGNLESPLIYRCD
jgi:hypothetical protein